MINASLVSLPVVFVVKVFSGNASEDINETVLNGDAKTAAASLHGRLWNANVHFVVLKKAQDVEFIRVIGEVVKYRFLCVIQTAKYEYLIHLKVDVPGKWQEFVRHM